MLNVSQNENIFEKCGLDLIREHQNEKKSSFWNQRLGSKENTIAQRIIQSERTFDFDYE